MAHVARHRTASRFSLLRVVTILLMFCLSFGLPVGGAIVYVNRSTAEIEGAAESVITPALSVGSRRRLVRIAHHDGLNPEQGRDFLITAWFNLRSLPDPKDRMVLFSKANPSSRQKEGYQAILSVAEDGVRVTVSWKDKAGKGRSYQFSGLRVVPQSWFMLALSLHDERYLGLHMVTTMPGAGAKPTVALIGGYDLGTEVRPDSTEELILGAARPGQYQGLIGPVGIFQGKKVSEELPRILKEMGRTPAVVPELLKRAVRFFSADLQRDDGPQQLQIVREGV